MYTKTDWKDHILSDNSYRITENPDGTFKILPAGEIAQQGTKMSALNFNKMENGIADAHEMAEKIGLAVNNIENQIGNISAVLETIVEVNE